MGDDGLSEEMSWLALWRMQNLKAKGVDYLPVGEDVDLLRSLVDSNMFLQAWDIASQWAPLEDWEGAKAARLAAQLASKLGAFRAGDRMDILNFRKYNEDDACFLFGQFARLNQFGGLRVLPGLDARLADDSVVGAQRAELMAVKASVLGGWEDFDMALSLIDEALEIAGNDSWIHAQKSGILSMADRYADAEQVARHALELRKHYTPAVQQLVQCLTDLGRDEEAMEILQEAHEATENGAFAGRLQAFYSEREDHVNALKWLDEYVRLTPLLEKRSIKWVVSRRCDFLYMAGDIEQYIELSEKAGKYHKRVAKRLGEPAVAERKRKRLDVPFVRQHSMTCAPATLAAISSYFGKEHDHLEIADAICYDGTPWHKERQWAENHGFVVREFRVTRGIVIDLIDRGVPFTLTTSWATGAHLQACIGYDDLQGTVLLRDPTHRHFGELILQDLIEEHPIEGPRGMVLVPEEKVELLDDLDFPDEVVYDARATLMEAIDDHNRVKIMEAFATMRVCGKDHPMLLSARLSLAWYDRDASEERKIMDEMIARFPEHPRTQLRHLYAIQKTEGVGIQRNVLQSILDQGKCDSTFYSEMGELLLGDVSTVDMACYYLHKAVRYRRSDSRAYASLARVEYQKREMESSLLCRRIAACLNAKFEPYSRAYFDLCVELGRVDEGLDFLRNRVTRFGSKDSGPWITLVNSLESLCRDGEAREVLKKAMGELPKDGELMMTAVAKWVGWGKLQKAYQLLDESLELVTENRWCREMARAADVDGSRPKALRYWKRVIELEDASVSAQRNHARLLVDEYGVEAAIEHLSQLADKYPDREDILTLYAEWLIEKDVNHAIEVMEKAVELAPNDSWNLRELAIYRARAGDMEGAIESVLLAVEKNPRTAESHGVLGGFYFQQHRYEQAAECFRKSVRLDVDYTYAIEKWVQCGVESGNVSEVLSEILSALRSQITTGSAITAYRESAYKHIVPEVLLAELKEVCGLRADLWESWYALKCQQLDMGLNDEALETAKGMTKKFPLTPRAWAELGDVRRARGEHEKGIKALEKALKMSPSWDWLARKLCSIYEAEGRLKEAEATQRKAIEWNPRNAANYGVLADMLWKQGRREEAMELLCEGLANDYHYGWGWSRLGAWGSVLDNEEPVMQLIAGYRDRFGHRSSWWDKEANIYCDLGKMDEALQAVEKGLECDPEDCDLYVSKAFYLSRVGRIDDAMKATDPPVYQGSVPRELLARRAWLLKNYGHGNEAEKLLVKLAEDHPDYVWPRRELLNYRHGAQDWRGVVSAARELIRLEPDDALPYGWLGDAHEKLMDQQAAVEAYEKAFHVDPEYSFAVYRMGTIWLNTGQHDRLRKIMPSIEYHQSGGLVETFKTRLACADNDPEAAFEALRFALREADIDDSDIEGLRASFEKAGWIKQYVKTRDEEVDRGGIKSGSVLADWIVGKRLPMRLAKRIHSMDYPLEVKEKAWAFIMSWIVDDRFDDDAVKLVKKYPEVKESTYLWGQAAWMLVTLGKYAEVIRLMTPLQKREGMEDWMLYNLAIAVSSLKGADAARFAAQFSLENLEPGYLTVAHAMSEALMCAKDGDDASARDYIRVYGDEADGWSKGLKLLAEMVLVSNDRGQASQIWAEFERGFSTWRTDVHYHAYVYAAKKAFKLRKAKWPGPRFLRKKRVSRSTPGWVWIIFFVLFGWKLVALLFGGIIALFSD